jgi:hypothetical protein
MALNAFSFNGKPTTPASEDAVACGSPLNNHLIR